jgi:hypothetical protein
MVLAHAAQIVGQRIRELVACGQMLVFAGRFGRFDDTPNSMDAMA